MSEQTSNPQTPGTRKPIKRHRYNRVTASIWEHQSSEGRYFYKTTFAKSYRDKETGDWKNTSSFTHAELSEIPLLVNQVNNTIMELDKVNKINRETAADRQATRENPQPEKSQPQQTGLQAQRDAAMLNASDQATQQTQNQTSQQSRIPPHVPEQ